MNCIVVDDEPLAREAVEILIRREGNLEYLASFNSADAASVFMESTPVDLIFLDVQMPGTDGLEFARSLSRNTLVIFTTAFAEYALDSYEVEAIDYLVKPIRFERFIKAVNKAMSYRSMLETAEKEDVEEVGSEFIIVKSERRHYKIYLSDILYIEGLKDYVIIHLDGKRIITKMNLKNIHEKLPKKNFLRVNKSNIVNSFYITSFDNNSLDVKSNVIAIGNTYREDFFDKFIPKKM